jgi:all-trans-retinol dehydrogenase (NAD+)
MDSINKYESENYERAEPMKEISTNYFKVIFKALLFFLELFIRSFAEVTMNLARRFFVKPEKKNISGQLALVTGSANGLGRAIACRLAEEKCNLAIVDMNFKAAQETAVFIEKTYNVKTKAFKVDVSDFEEIQQLKIDIESNLGTVDILVNNAGILAAISLREGKPQDIQKIVDVNLTSHFWVFLLLEIFQEFLQIPSPSLRLFVHFWMG